MVKKYKARKNCIFSDKDVRLFAPRIEELMKNNGGELKPQTVVDDAKNNRSPLHKYFEWDNDRAANLYRIHQARKMIQAVVEVKYYDGERVEQKSFYNVKSNGTGKRVYVSLKKVQDTPSYLQQLIDDATDYIDYFRGVLVSLKSEVKKRK